MEIRTRLQLLSVITVLVLVVHKVNSQTTKCPQGWFPFLTNGKRTDCVWLSTDKERWINAVNWCKLLGGQLVEINPIDGNTVISILINGKKTGKYWIGLSDAESNHNYKWMTSRQPLSSVLHFTKTGNSGGDPVKNCVATDEKGKWFDEACSAEFQFICQKQA